MSCETGVTAWSDPHAPLTAQLMEFCSQLACPADLPVWQSLLEGGSGPLVYIGPGTGRRALALAAAGEQIIAVEASPTMAAAFRARLAVSAAALRERVVLVESRIEDAQPAQRCAAVIAPGMLLNYAVTEPACQLAFLRACRAWLDPGGVLALELYNPYFLMNEGAVQLPPGPEQPGDSAWLSMMIHRAAVDPWSQRCSSYRLLCERFEPGGAVRRYVIPTSTVVSVFPRELALLLDAAGFQLEGVQALSLGARPPAAADLTLLARARAR